MEKQILNEIININKAELIILTGSMLSGKTSMMLKILKEANKKNISVAFFSFELLKDEVTKKIDSEKQNVFIYDKSFIKSYYIETIIERCRNLKVKSDLKLIMIDGLCEIQSLEPYVMGRGDIVSIIIRQLKELSTQLDIPILVTAHCSNMNDNKQNKDTKMILSDFCKKETAEEYVDRIIFLKQ